MPPIFRPFEVAREPGRLLFVGDTEDENKGFRLLLRAVRSVRERLPCNLTVVCRAGSHRAQRLVRELGLFGCVTFLEELPVEQLVCQYNRAQVLVSPSLYEGFGLPALEAQACGTPVVATTVGAMVDVIEDGTSGLLVPPGDVPALAAAIEGLLPDVDRCLAMGAVGRERALQRYSWREAAERTVAVYDSARRSRAAAGAR